MLVLPALLERLERVNDNTDALPDILAQLRAVQADTACRCRMSERMRWIEQMRGTWSRSSRTRWPSSAWPRPPCRSRAPPRGSAASRTACRNARHRAAPRAANGGVALPPEGA